MEDLSILLQGYGPEVLDERYCVRDSELIMELRHGEKMPKDNGRTDGCFDRIELSIKPKEKLSWRSGDQTWAYQVVAPWNETSVGEGHIILGQIHCSVPLFSLRWAPKPHKSLGRLWMDFFTIDPKNSGQTVKIENLLSGLTENVPLRVEIESSARADQNLNLRVVVSAGGRTQESPLITCDLEKMKIGDDEPLRFKVGAYRKRKDRERWAPMKFTYSDVRLNGECIEREVLERPQYDPG